MQQANIDGTGFEWDDSLTGKLKITTPEGSTVAVPLESVLKWVYGCYVLPGRQSRDGRKDWREGLLG